jgi:hypothetical protein
MQKRVALNTSEVSSTQLPQLKQLPQLSGRRSRPRNVAAELIEDLNLFDRSTQDELRKVLGRRIAQSETQNEKQTERENKRESETERQNERERPGQTVGRLRVEKF